jgi:hypothetical protein
MFRRFLAIAALMGALFMLGACEEAPPPPDPAKIVPTNPSDSAAWKKYVAAISKTYVPADQSSRIFATFVEYGQDEEKTARHIENTKNFIGRGIAEGTTLLFASPDSPLMANIVEQAFADPRADLLKSIRVIFIGQKAEEERVRTAVTAWGATFIFHEAK